MSYRFNWEIEIKHDGLGKYRLIKGQDKHVVEQKAAMQKRIWDEMWKKKQEIEKRKKESLKKAINKEEKKQLASDRTDEAQKILEQITNTLKYTLNIDDSIDWDSLIDKSEFLKPRSSRPILPPFPPTPHTKNTKYAPKLNFFDYLFPKLKQKKMKIAEELHTKEVEEIKKKNKELEENYKSSITAWENEKTHYLKDMDEKNKQIFEKKEKYFNKDRDAIIEYCDMVLSNSNYPDSFPQDFDIDYNTESKIMIIDYFLPSLEDIPKLKEVKYVIAKDAFTEVYLSETAINKIYDNLLYQISLRTMHELYEADQIEALDSIVFNGWVKSIDKGTGQEVTACILSIQANKEEFRSINLENVDPKICFKTLKGVASSKLHGLTPIAPILRMDRNDKRFIQSYDVVDSIDNTTNLAVMDWEDFEHLIRQVFEAEFSQNGGEVKITQASHDRGVDAIAFDPDPIRGGKIVIQAKRYTNIVGVSFVRDLYGTVMNEGATKGILVTTADYGPDAYEFAKDKPLTLLNGSNLLHLLASHGHKAKIDLKEAKQILAEQKRENKI